MEARMISARAGPTATAQPTRFYGRTELDTVRAIRDLGTILEEVTKHLDGTGQEVTLTLEINARSEGYDTRTQRIVRGKRHPTRLRLPRIRRLTDQAISHDSMLLLWCPATVGDRQVRR